MTRRELIDELKGMGELDDPVVVSAVRSDVGWAALRVREVVLPDGRHAAAVEMSRVPTALEDAPAVEL